jgi:hypothetical protein
MSLAMGMKRESAKPDRDATLSGSIRPSDLQWVRHLVHQPQPSTGTSVLRDGLCLSQRRQSVLADQAFEAPDHSDQVIALNLLSEGVAFGFYGAVIPVLDRLKILGGQPCSEYADDMGLDRRVVGSASTEEKLHHGMLRLCTRLRDQMLGLLVGARGAALTQI